MTPDQVRNLVIELIAKQSEVVRDVAARNCITESELSDHVGRFKKDIGDIGLPGTFTLDDPADCEDGKVKPSGNVGTGSNERFLGFTAELLQSGDPDPAITDPPHPYMTLSEIELDANPGDTGQIAIWAHFQVSILRRSDYTCPEMGP